MAPDFPISPGRPGSPRRPIGPCKMTEHSMQKEWDFNTKCFTDCSTWSAAYQSVTDWYSIQVYKGRLSEYHIKKHRQTLILLNYYYNTVCHGKEKFYTQYIFIP